MRKSNAAWMGVTGDAQGDFNLIVNGVYIDTMYIYIYTCIFMHSIIYILYASR